MKSGTSKFKDIKGVANELMRTTSMVTNVFKNLDAI
jgi:hypothetical protein